MQHMNSKIATKIGRVFGSILESDYTTYVGYSSRGISKEIPHNKTKLIASESLQEGFHLPFQVDPMQKSHLNTNVSHIFVTFVDA